MKNTQEQISKIIIKLLLKEPFYGHFCTSIIKNITDDIPTLAVNLQKNEMVQLLVNENFWNKELINDEYKYGGLKHEILHIVFKHLLRMDDFSHKEIFNISADLVVNQYIEDSQLIDGVVKLDLFPELKLEKEQTLDYYYKKLTQLLEENINGKVENNKNKSWENLKNFINGEGDVIDVHEWKNTLSEAEKRVLNSIINDAIVTVVDRMKNKDKNYGNLPAGLMNHINNILKSLKPEVSRKRVLRLFATNSSKTFIKTTIKKVSKRYGTTPGIKIKKKNKLLVAIDTSGSIQQTELNKFFSELYHIYKQGSEILVIECDTKIHNKYKYTGITPDVIFGGGGTDFNAPIEFANKLYKPDAIIYFTDLYALVPKIKSRVPMLWMVTIDGEEENTEFWNTFEGRKVKMK